MDEVGRVVERRREPYLAPFRDFLAEHWREDEAFFDALAVFDRWSKETLRDPVAHGRGETVGYEQLRRFREQILFGLDQAPKGALAQLVSPR